MKIKALRKDLEKVLRKHSLIRKFNKQKGLFEKNPRHPSLNTEKLESKNLDIYSFRIDRKWRAICIFISQEEIEIVDINLHYR